MAELTREEILISSAEFHRVIHYLLDQLGGIVEVPPCSEYEGGSLEFRDGGLPRSTPPGIPAKEKRNTWQRH